MLNFIINRLLQFLPTIFGVASLTFFFIHLIPGDPIENLLGEDALAADREAMREALGLDEPIYTQYINYLSNLLHGDLGTSLYSNRAVTTLILERLPATFELALTAFVFAVVLSFPLGIWAAVHKKQWQDKVAMTGSLLGFSMPNFWLGPLLIIVFSVWLGVFPVSGREDGFMSLILPAITLGTGMAAVLSRLVRSSLLEVLSADYMRTAKAKGVKRRTLICKHGLRNALLPVMTVLFLQVGTLLTGAIITEAVFSWPGLGTLMIDALNARDYMVVQGCILFIAFIYLTMTLVADILYAFIDPRIRFSGGKANG